MNESNEDFFSYRHSILTEFFQALWFALIANTEVICYLVIFLNGIASMSILTLPLSLMVLLWATLSIPRPSKRFWSAIIIYAQVTFLLQKNDQILYFSRFLSITRLCISCNMLFKYFLTSTLYSSLNRTLHIIWLYYILCSFIGRDRFDFFFFPFLNVRKYYIGLCWRIWEYGHTTKSIAIKPALYLNFSTLAWCKCNANATKNYKLFKEKLSFPLEKGQQASINAIDNYKSQLTSTLIYSCVISLISLCYFLDFLRSV